MRAAEAFVPSSAEDEPAEAAELECAGLSGAAFEALVGCLVSELEAQSDAVGERAGQLASVLREVAERCADDGFEHQADAMSHLLFVAHDLLAGVPSEPVVVTERQLRDEPMFQPVRSVSIVPESGVVRRSTLREPSSPALSPALSTASGGSPSVRGLEQLPGEVSICDASDFDDETEVTMPAITRMDVSVFDIDDDESEHTLPGVVPPSQRRNGLRLG